MERCTGPLRGPDRTESPLFAGCGRLQEPAPVAGALERDRDRPRRQCADFFKGRGSGSADLAVDLDLSWRVRYREMRADVVAACRHDRSALLLKLCFRIQRFLAQDQKIVVAHAISLPAAAD